MGTIIDTERTSFAKGYRAGRFKTAMFFTLMIAMFLAGRYGKEMDLGNSAVAATPVQQQAFWDAIDSKAVPINQMASPEHIEIPVRPRGF